MRLVLWITLILFSSLGIATSQDWSQFVRSLNALEYRVKPGDTLSRITQKQLGSKNYWPKLWEINQKTLSNPHLLEPDQTLLFDHSLPVENRSPSSMPQEAQPKVPEKVSEEIPDALLRPAFQHKHRLRFLVLSPQEMLGVVTGTYEDRNFLNLNNLVYIGAFDKEKIIPNQTYALVKEISEKEKAGLDPHLQSLPLKRVVGEVQIERYQEDLALGRIVSAQELIERGDKLAQVPTLTLQEPETPAPDGSKSKILLGESLQNKLVLPGQLALLEGGSKTGIQLGNVFSVFEDEDPVFKSHHLIEPRSKAEIKVVWVGEEICVGYLMKAQGLVQVGDVLISSKYFPKTNAKSSPYRQKVSIE